MEIKEPRSGQVRFDNAKVTFIGERVRGSKAFNVIQIQSREHEKWPEFQDINLWDKMLQNSMNVGDTVDVLCWVKGSRQIGDDAVAYTNLFLAAYQVVGSAPMDSQGASDEPQIDEESDLDGLGDGENLPF